MGKWLDFPLYSVSGGMDTLPKAFMAKNSHGWNLDVELQKSIVYAAIVEKIEPIDEKNGKSQRLRIVSKNAHTGKSQIHAADAVILTAPLPTISRIDIPWSEDRKRILADVKTWSATKLFFQCRRRFWEEDVGRGGVTKTNMQIGELHYPASNHSCSDRGILLLYTWIDDAKAFGEEDKDKALTKAVDMVSKLHPEISDEFETGAVQAWGQEPYSQCTITSLGTSDFLERFETLTTPTTDLPIYVAGDSLAWANSWMQGAIFSGLLQAYCFQCSVEDGSFVSPFQLLAKIG